MSALDRGDLEPLNKASQSGLTWHTWLELHLADNGKGAKDASISLSRAISCSVEGCRVWECEVKCRVGD